MSKPGYAFIEGRAHFEDAVYGGAMSARQHFGEFVYCDSGIISWLLISERVSCGNLSLAGMVEQQLRTYPCSDEINFRIHHPASVIDRIMQSFSVDH